MVSDPKTHFSMNLVLFPRPKDEEGMRSMFIIAMQALCKPMQGQSLFQFRLEMLLKMFPENCYESMFT